MATVSTKEIKTRIRSMESTKQITKAMEMVVASKLRKAQAQVLSSRPYFEILYSTINEIVDANRDFSSPYLTKRTVQKSANDRQLWKCLEHRQKAVRIGEIITVIARVHQHNEIFPLAKLINTHHTRVINGKPLNIGMNFDAVKPQRFDLLDDGILIFTIGMCRTKTDKAFGCLCHLGSNKGADALNLMRRCGNRMHHKTVNANLVANL